MRPLAVLVGCLSLCQLLAAVVFAGPHTDVPAQPLTSLLVVGAALAGFALARALWRRRAGVAGGLLAWGAGIALCVVGLVAVVASPSEQRDAWPAVAVGLGLWAVLIAWAARALARRPGASHPPPG